MSVDKLPVNLFDIVLVGVLVIGILRGRKHGMSEELLPVLKWFALLCACALAYEPLGSLFSQSSRVFSMLTCYVMAYIAIGMTVLILFAAVKRGLGGKLVGSDIFGKAEYPLGMASGCIRAACTLLAVLALLNARFFSPAEIKAMEKFQNDVYGSNFFPGLHSLQSTVFESSLTGPWIKDNLSFLLIKPTAPEDKQIKQKEYTFPQ
jgi:uncharacterized membrane protein required for colicin V production